MDAGEALDAASRVANRIAAAKGRLDKWRTLIQHTGLDQIRWTLVDGKAATGLGPRAATPWVAVRGGDHSSPHRGGRGAGRPRRPPRPTSRRTASTRRICSSDHSPPSARSAGAGKTGRPGEPKSLLRFSKSPHYPQALSGTREHRPRRPDVWRQALASTASWHRRTVDRLRRRPLWEPGAFPALGPYARDWFERFWWLQFAHPFSNCCVPPRPFFMSVLVPLLALAQCGPLLLTHVVAAQPLRLPVATPDLPESHSSLHSLGVTLHGLPECLPLGSAQK